MLLNAEAKAARLTEVATQQLELLHLQTTLNQLHSLLPSNSDVARNLLVSSNAEGSHGVTGCNNVKVKSCQCGM